MNHLLVYEMSHHFSRSHAYNLVVSLKRSLELNDDSVDNESHNVR